MNVAARFRFFVVGVCLLTISLPRPIGAAEPPAQAAILQDLRSFKEMGTVLHIAAHPDDENTTLLTYLRAARVAAPRTCRSRAGTAARTCYGPEFGETLGVLRTQELLAARRLDGARQFFTRAVDFGFSKDAAKTMSIWGKDQVLGDVVRVIRYFQPDIIVTRFSPIPGGTHGHHTASAILAVEAFNLAGDSQAYPEQISGGLTRWQPKRLVQNGGGKLRRCASTSAASTPSSTSLLPR